MVLITSHPFLDLIRFALPCKDDSVPYLTKYLSYDVQPASVKRQKQQLYQEVMSPNLTTDTRINTNKFLAKVQGQTLQMADLLYCYVTTLYFQRNCIRNRQQKEKYIKRYFEYGVVGDAFQIVAISWIPRKLIPKICYSNLIFDFFLEFMQIISSTKIFSNFV